MILDRMWRRIPIGFHLAGALCVGLAFTALGVWCATTLPARASARPPVSSRAASADAPKAEALRLSPLDRPQAGLDPGDPASARKINQAIPFASAPVEHARPFVLNTGLEDRRRAADCLAAAIYYEAGYEPVEGQRAVAQVVLNRVRHPAFPKTVCGVVFEGAQHAGCQFSFTCDGSLARAPDPATLRRARRVAAEALDGHVEPLVGTSTHYHADYVAPYWGRTLYKIRQIGAHIFYRWPGSAGLRSAFAGRYAGHEAGLQTASTAPVSDKLAEPAERRADDDVGGRIIPGLGWTPSVPVVTGATSSYDRLVAGQQAGVVEAAKPRQGAGLS